MADAPFRTYAGTCLGFRQTPLHGPLGTNCTTTKVDSSTPNSVGSINNKRLRGIDHHGLAHQVSMAQPSPWA